MSGGDVEIVEVGPRDGLQAETNVLAVDERIELIRRLASAGLRRIEVASFVHPKRVPQMAEAEAVVAGLTDLPECSTIGLVLNRRGLERALTTSVDEVNFVVAAADGYNRSNQGVPAAETMAAIEEMIPDALDAGRQVSVTISVAFGCPYDGEVPVDAVTTLAARSAAAGAGEVALGDTIGVAVPTDVVERVTAVQAEAPGVRVRCHFHDTRHAGLANVYAALTMGVTTFDASTGGIGGSPFAPNAGGNVATEDLLFMLDRMGRTHGVDAEMVLETARRLRGLLAHELPGAASKVDRWPPETP